MPTVNVFSNDNEKLQEFEKVIDELKVLVAEQLSNDHIHLDTNEVSVRLIKTIGLGMLASIELEITAHAFKERIQKQDEICLNVRQFLKQRIEVDEIRVWLLLPELGHSWE